MDPRVPSLTEVCRYLSDPALDGRAPGTEGHEIARRYLAGMLLALGFEPLFGPSFGQPIVRDGRTYGENLAGFQRGSAGRAILVAAHYDHLRGIPGADDNAAAVAIVVEAARKLAPWKGAHDLVLCFFDLEEPPYFHSGLMGSAYFAAHPPIDLAKVDCAIVLDLCGHDFPLPGREDALFVMGAEYSPSLVTAVRASQGRSPSAYMFQNARIPDMSDHWAFRQRGVPFLFLSCGPSEHYHRASDTFDKLNLHKMASIAELLEALVRSLDAEMVRIDPVPDFWRIERESLERLVGMEIPEDPVLLTAEIEQLVSMFGW